MLQQWENRTLKLNKITSLKYLCKPWGLFLNRGKKWLSILQPKSFFYLLVRKIVFKSSNFQIWKKKIPYSLHKSFNQHVTSLRVVWRVLSCSQYRSILSSLAADDARASVITSITSYIIIFKLKSQQPLKMGLDVTACGKLLLQFLWNRALAIFLPNCILNCVLNPCIRILRIS